MSFQSSSAYKEQAARLRAFLANKGIDLKHTNALEAVAQMQGVKNWHVLQTLADKDPGTPTQSSTGKRFQIVDPDSSSTTRITVDLPTEREEAFYRLLVEFSRGDTVHDEAVRQQAREREQGLNSLGELATVARGDSGQCRYIARFLAGLYNGSRFPFDLTDLRAIDDSLFEHCLAVLRLDHRPRKEVHDYFPNGSALWENEIIDAWSLDRMMALDAARILVDFLWHRSDKKYRPLADDIEAWRRDIQNQRDEE